jgi:hypothetical protein
MRTIPDVGAIQRLCSNLNRSPRRGRHPPDQGESTINYQLRTFSATQPLPPAESQAQFRRRDQARNGASTVSRPGR